MNELERILIIRLSSLGDILLTTPVIRAIKRKHPDLKIDFLLKPEYKQVYEYNPYIDSLFFYTEDRNLLRDLRKNRYDLVIDLQNNFRSRKLTKRLGVLRRVFKKPALNKFLLVQFKINRYKKIISIPEYYARAIDNLILDEKGIDLFLPDNIKPELTAGTDYIGFCPGSKHFTKMWPKDYFVELGNMLAEKGFSVVVFGGKDDKQIAFEITGRVPGAINLSNDNDLFHTAINMKKCKLVICNDSGLMHTASALNVPLIAVFGSTVKEFGFFPYKTNSLILENNSLNCRPCSHIGRSNCPEKHFKCMLEITPQTVYQNVQRLLSE